LDTLPHNAAVAGEMLLLLLLQQEVVLLQPA
jgi:hypothetical protein